MAFGMAAGLLASMKAGEPKERKKEKGWGHDFGASIGNAIEKGMDKHGKGISWIGWGLAAGGLASALGSIAFAAALVKIVKIVMQGGVGLYWLYTPRCWGREMDGVVYDTCWNLAFVTLIHVP
jgi:hypothetical protein